MSQLFSSDDQDIGASVSAFVLLMSIQGSFPSGLTGLISLLSKELSRVFSFTTVSITNHVDHNKLWKILKQIGIPDHLICLLRNLYACQEATVRTGHGTTERFQIGKGVCQGCILSPCLNYMQSNHEKCWTG